MRGLKTIAVTCFTVIASAMAHAGSLQVSPVSVEMRTPQVTTNLTLRNTGQIPLKAQVRVFRWSQANGQDVLEPASDVVASPPVATVVPGKEFTVRLVRTATGAVAEEQTYRVIVDELPDAATKKTGTINMAFRYSIPVFVMPTNDGKADVSWSVRDVGGKSVLWAENTGDRRVRVSELNITDGSGKKTTLAKGLAGYVLARSSMSWVAPGVGKGSQGLQISATGDTGAINATAGAAQAR